LQGIQTAITILKDFAFQFSSLQATNTRLQKDAVSNSSKLDHAITMDANSRQEVDVLKKELDQLKKKMKEEEKAKAENQALQKAKEDLLLRSIMSLLGNIIVLSSNFPHSILLAYNLCLCFGRSG
jgi:hypothetical protein